MTNDCVFCWRSELPMLAENELAFAVRGTSPVRHLHTLILKRHVADSFDLTLQELGAIFDLARQTRDAIMVVDPSVGGFNFGSYNGAIAGQKVQHAHFHLIPRRADEAAPPRARPS